MANFRFSVQITCKYIGTLKGIDIVGVFVLIVVTSRSFFGPVTRKEQHPKRKPLQMGAARALFKGEKWLARPIKEYHNVVVCQRVF